jgi:metal-responsive CopG/Arc/MetJ family transcriptional regulator
MTKPKVQANRMKTQTMSVSLTLRDLELTQDMQEYYGCSRSEIVRMAIRAYAHQTQKLKTN